MFRFSGSSRLKHFYVILVQITIIDINETTKQAKIRKGVRQVYPLPPYLFNIFIEASINELKSKTGE